MNHIIINVGRPQVSYLASEIAKAAERKQSFLEFSAKSDEQQSNRRIKFYFDAIYNGINDLIYEQTGKKMSEAFMESHSSMVIAYGQTSSGKKHF